MSPRPTTRRSSTRTPKSGRSSRRAARKSTAATELSRRSPTEKKIEEALKQPTQIEFVETPLKDVVDYLKDLHHIEIQLDSAALKEAGVDESTPVTKNLKGISLRSALKLLLDELQLKYVIHNEVLLITSPAKAESDEYMTTKVYPMADLVLPIKESGFTGGFGNIGGTGNSMMGGGNNGSNGKRQQYVWKPQSDGKRKPDGKWQRERMEISLEVATRWETACSTSPAKSSRAATRVM